MPDVDFVTASGLYRTEPWEQAPGRRPDDEHWYFNCVVAIETGAGPGAAARAPAGRRARARARARRTGTPEDRRYEPRPLDIDILLYEDRVISGPDHLHVPHLFLHERRFVLHPLADLAPEFEHPVLYRTIQELLDAVDDEHRVVPIDLPRRWFDL